MRKKVKTPWPTKAVMNQIYEQQLWGGSEFDFYSGDGSHQEDIIMPYLEAAISFLKSHLKKLTICDLGCGDFNIGKHLTPWASKYIAIDIAEQLIERNKSVFKAAHLEFHCLDISTDALPKSDLAILRQVLQHLSNAEITRIVQKLKHFKYILLTEHVPTGSFVPNKDIISGQGIRLKYNSGVDLLAEPFNLDVSEMKVINRYTLGPKKGEIVTLLLTQ